MSEMNTILPSGSLFINSKLNNAITTKSENKLSPMMVLMIILAPYFMLRFGGTDFEKGSSFALVDLFVLVALLKALPILKQEIKHNLSYPFTTISLIGIIFCLIGLLNYFSGKYYYHYSISLYGVLSTVSQYAVVLIGLPLIAFCFLRGKTESVIKLICIGFLPPLLLTQFFTPEMFSEPYSNFLFPTEQINYYFRAKHIFYLYRATGTYGNPNSFAIVTLTTLPLYVWLAATQKKYWSMMGYIGQTASIISLIETLSFTGYLVTLIGIVCHIGLLLWKKNPVHQSKQKLQTYLTYSFALFLGSVIALNYYAPNEMMTIQKRFITPAATLQSEQEGIYANGIHANGIHANGIHANGIYANEIYANGIYANGIYANGIHANGIHANKTFALYGTGAQRLQLMFIAIDIIAKRNGGIFSGHGLKNTTTLPEFNFIYHGNNIQLNVHNLYLLLWIEGGLILVLLFLGYLFFLGYSLLKQSDEVNSIKLALITSLFLFTVAAAFNTHLYLRYYWIPLLPIYCVIFSKNTFKLKIHS